MSIKKRHHIGEIWCLKIEFCKGLLFTEIVLLLLCVIICLGEFRNDANTESLHLSNQGFRGIKVTKNYIRSNILYYLSVHVIY